MFVVAKPFNSMLRRFRVGQEVAETEDVAPLSFDHLKERGFLAPKPAAPAASAKPAAAARRSTQDAG